MKTKTAFFIIILFIFSACAEREEPQVFNSNEIGVMRTPNNQLTNFLTHMDSWVLQKRRISSAEFESEIYHSWPGIDLGILNDFRNQGIIGQDEPVKLEYHYFKKGKCDMQNSEGIFVPVNLVGTNKFVVRVIREQGLEDLWVSLACSNGMLSIQRESDIHVTARMQFTIEKGKGLSYYLRNDLWSIQVAETFGLDLFKGKGYRKRITPDQARELVPRTDEIQITVKVHPGWKFLLDGSDMRIFIPGKRWMSPEEFQNESN